MKYCLILIVLSLGVRFAQAETPATAKTRYQAGILHYNLNEFAEALAEFKEAYRLKPDPALLFNIAQCHRQLGEYGQAANFYRSYRRESPDMRNRAEVERLLAEMEKAAAEQRAKQPPTGTVTPTETQTTGKTPDADKTPATVKSSSESNSSSTTQLTQRAPEKPLTRRAWFWGVVAGGAVVVAAGVTLGVIFGTPARNPPLSYGQVVGN